VIPIGPVVRGEWGDAEEAGRELLLGPKHTWDSLSAVYTIAAGFAGQAWNAREATQTVLAGSTASPGHAGIALVATVASRTHGSRGAGDTWLLLKLLHFRRQSA
jgi:hypothetical protein